MAIFETVSTLHFNFKKYALFVGHMKMTDVSRKLPIFNHIQCILQHIIRTLCIITRTGNEGVILSRYNFITYLLQTLAYGIALNTAKYMRRIVPLAPPVNLLSRLYRKYREIEYNLQRT